MTAALLVAVFIAAGLSTALVVALLLNQPRLNPPADSDRNTTT